MELKIIGRDMELDEQTREHIARKLNRLSRHLPGITTAIVELARGNTRSQSHKAVAQVTLDIKGTVLRGEERAANAIAAVDSVTSVLDRRVERYKGKAYSSKQAKRAGKNVSIRTLAANVPSHLEGSDDDEIEEIQGKSVRLKRFPIKPMTLSEAAFQMELLGHDFFLFLNSETDQYSVLYERHDGDYGLIQPEPL